uniref:Uncharacterized protein n=1 Tax=Oryza brachyantha TaxID=4533 RepID=J3LXV4_ORYBR
MAKAPAARAPTSPKRSFFLWSFSSFLYFSESSRDDPSYSSSASALGFLYPPPPLPYSSSPTGLSSPPLRSRS